MISNVATSPAQMRTIAYIAPELTALSETFVYQELSAIEGMGWRVLPFAVQQPQHPAREAQGIASRTVVLYEGTRLRQIFNGLRAAWQLGRQALPAARMLIGDMRKIGLADRRAWNLAFQWLAAARMAQPLKTARCTHIHAHFVHVPTQIAMYASAMTGIPFTCTAHANDLFCNGLLLPEKAQRARKLLTISHFNKAWLQDQGVRAEQVDVVRCAPELSGERAASLASAEAAWRRGTSRPAALGGPAAPMRATGRRHSGAYRIGTLGSLVEKKGVDDLIRAVAQLIREGCAPVKLLVAGEGPERLRLQVLSDQLGIHPHVEFVGSVSHHAVAHWMRSLDLFVTACKLDRHGDVDGIPVALMEAMSLGVPVVSTRISGVPELVVDGQTGLLAEPASPSSLAAKIDEAMSHPERARSLGRAARAHVRWEFGREVNLRRLVKHFGDPHVAPSRPAALEEAA